MRALLLVALVACGGVARPADPAPPLRTMTVQLRPRELCRVAIAGIVELPGANHEMVRALDQDLRSYVRAKTRLATQDARYSAFDWTTISACTVEDPACMAGLARESEAGCLLYGFIRALPDGAHRVRIVLLDREAGFDRAWESSPGVDTRDQEQATVARAITDLLDAAAISVTTRLGTDATILVDGTPRARFPGATPQIVMPLGTHELRIEAAGFAPYALSMTLTSHQVVGVDVRAVR